MKNATLRHRITIQRYVETEDPVTGYRTKAWEDAFPAVTALGGFAASFLPGPGREYLASEALRSEVQGRLIVRWSDDAREIRAYDRVLWDGRTWELKSGPIPDETARRSLTLMIGGVTRDPAG